MAIQRILLLREVDEYHHITKGRKRLHNLMKNKVGDFAKRACCTMRTEQSHFSIEDSHKSGSDAAGD
jgi:hypothetical protein